jgi:hypothetical protein
MKEEYEKNDEENTEQTSNESVPTLKKSLGKEGTGRIAIPY